MYVNFLKGGKSGLLYFKTAVYRSYKRGVGALTIQQTVNEAFWGQVMRMQRPEVQPRSPKGNRMLNMKDLLSRQAKLYSIEIIIIPSFIKSVYSFSKHILAHLWRRHFFGKTFNRKHAVLYVLVCNLHVLSHILWAEINVFFFLTMWHFATCF